MANENPTPNFTDEIRRGRFVNQFNIGGVGDTIIVDAGMIDPQSQQTKEFLVQARLVMTPVTFKILTNLCNTIVKQYEKQAGAEIKLPEQPKKGGPAAPIHGYA